MTPEQIDAERERFEASEVARDLDLTRQVDGSGYLYYPTSVCWIAWLARAQEAEPARAETVAWRPIETAPRDGTEILAYFGPDVGVKQVSWTEPEAWDDEHWCVDDNKHGPFMLRGWNDPYPTLWMPLPDPTRPSSPPPALPPGWVAVPVEPTEEMLRDGAAKVRAFFERHGPYPRTQAMYHAMLAAAPPHPAVSLPEGWPWDAETRSRMAHLLYAACGLWLRAEERATHDAMLALARWLEQSPEQGEQS